MDNLQIFSGPKSAKYGYQLNPYNTMIGALYEYHIAVKKIKRPMSDTERREWEAMVCGKLWYGSILINVCSAVPAVLIRHILHCLIQLFFQFLFQFLAQLIIAHCADRTALESEL